MPATMQDLLTRLDQLGIDHQTVEHPPLFTVDDAKRHVGHLPGGHSKNLFLKDKKGGLWLLVCLDERRIDMNRLAKELQSPRLSFGASDLLLEVLGVSPGSVTPFALLNDRDLLVQPVIDRAMLDHELLNFHPLDNRATATIKAADLPVFIRSTGHEFTIVDLDRTGIDRR